MELILAIISWLATFCAVVCYEFTILSFLIAFGAIPFAWVKKDTGIFFLTGLIITLITGLMAGVLFTLSSGYLEPIYFVGAFIPTMLLGMKVVGKFAGWTTDVKQETLFMKKGEYTIEATTDVLVPGSTLYDVQRIAKYKGKIVRFIGASPLEPQDILAYCTVTDGIYTCNSYEVVEKGKKTRKEWIETIHTLIIVACGVLMPVPVILASGWADRYGASDENPYMDLMAYFATLIIFGGCRKLMRDGKDSFTKVFGFISKAVYYFMLLSPALIGFLELLNRWLESTI